MGSARQGHFAVPLGDQRAGGVEPQGPRGCCRNHPDPDQGRGRDQEVGAESAGSDGSGQCELAPAVEGSAPPRNSASVFRAATAAQRRTHVHQCHCGVLVARGCEMPAALSTRSTRRFASHAPRHAMPAPDRMPHRTGLILIIPVITMKEGMLTKQDHLRVRPQT